MLLCAFLDAKQFINTIVCFSKYSIPVTQASYEGPLYFLTRNVIGRFFTLVNRDLIFLYSLIVIKDVIIFSCLRKRIFLSKRKSWMKSWVKRDSWTNFVLRDEFPDFWWFLKCTCCSRSTAAEHLTLNGGDTQTLSFDD